MLFFYFNIILLLSELYAKLKDRIRQTSIPYCQSQERISDVINNSPNRRCKRRLKRNTFHLFLRVRHHFRIEMLICPNELPLLEQE